MVLAGAGVAIGEAGHLGVAATVVLGVAGYGSRLLWAVLRRRWARQRAAWRRRQAEKVDPWSVPEPWRGYVRRALDARQRLGQLAGTCPPGPVADQLQQVAAGCAQPVQELWQLARGGAALAGPSGRTEKVAEQLRAVQAALVAARARPGGQVPGEARPAVPAGGQGQAGAQGGQPSGPGLAGLEAREAALASELRSARRLDEVASDVAGRLEALCSQLEGLVATAGELALSAGGAGADLGILSLRLSALNEALRDARRALPANGYAPGGAPTAGQP